MLADIEQKEAPHTEQMRWIRRGEGEEDSDSMYGIYNYILMEKWLKENDNI